MREPCGCEQARAALRSPELDLDAQRVRLQMAQDAQEYWNCPGAKTTEPESPPDLAEDRLRAVAALTGISGLKTCPHWYASLPCAHEAARARRWRDKGQLGNLEDQPCVLAAAIDQIDEGLSARERDDDERRDAELKRKRNG
jgi:hypothetical protein